MASDNNKSKSKSKTKKGTDKTKDSVIENVRQVTKDSQNSSVNSGKEPEPATLHFTFENIPQDDTFIGTSEVRYGLPDDYARKGEPSRPDQNSVGDVSKSPEGIGASLGRFVKDVGARIEAARAAREEEFRRQKELADKRTEEERKWQLAAAVDAYNSRKKAEKDGTAGDTAENRATITYAKEEASQGIDRDAPDRSPAEEKAYLEALDAAIAEEKAKRKADAEARIEEKERAEAEARAVREAADREKERARAIREAEAAERRAALEKARAEANERREIQKKVRAAEKARKKAENEKRRAAMAEERKAADALAAERMEKARAAKEKQKEEARAEKAKQKEQARAEREKQKKTKKPRKKLWWLWAIFKILFALIIAAGIAAGSYAAYTITHAPSIHPDRIYSMLDMSTHIYNDKGKLIDEIYYSENREVVKYEELPENLKNAFIAIEDKTFWTHRGYNFRRMIGAIWNSFRGGVEISGTSTITQQLARNVFLPEEKSVRSIKRKIIEMYYAHEIEEALSKEEILTAYLNTIYLGYGCYGVETAAEKYFSKDVEDLSLEQCAALAALPQAPGVYQLIVTEKGEATKKIKKGLYSNDISRERREMVLDLMAEQGYITEEEAEDAKKPLKKFIKPGKEFKSANSAFKDYLIETVIKDLMNEYDLTEEQATKLVYTKGLEIYSTLDSQAQKVITREFKNKESFPSALKENSKVEAAMVITEVGTGEIKAMAGTRSPKGEKLFNRATSPRQPGSSIKPIAVYGPALQKSYEYYMDGQKFPFVETGFDRQGTTGWGDYITASSTVTDEKMIVRGEVWPLNFGHTYTGYKNFRTAIQQSINTCSVKILAQIGTDYSIDMVKKFGITTAIDDTSEPYNDVNLAALGLGAMTEGVTPLEMSLAYATFPNGGVHNSGICYTKVTDSEGKVLLEGKSKETRVLDEGVAYIMTDVLQSVVSNGIAYDAAIPGERVGGKTGTTDDTWDIWFDGFTAKYSAALWIGTDDNTTLYTTSATAAALWSRIMSQVERAYGGTYRSMPSNVILQSGEYYISGTQPPLPPPSTKKYYRKGSKKN